MGCSAKPRGLAAAEIRHIRATSLSQRKLVDETRRSRATDVIPDTEKAERVGGDCSRCCSTHWEVTDAARPDNETGISRKYLWSSWSSRSGGGGF